MTDYFTPDIDTAREYYAIGAHEYAYTRFYAAREEFDRCIREVKADAWEQGAAAVEQGFIDRREVVNPYL